MYDMMHPIYINLYIQNDTLLSTGMSSQQELAASLIPLPCASFSFRIKFNRLGKYAPTRMQTLPNRGVVSKTWHKILRDPKMSVAVLPLHATMWRHNKNL
jgi:hypothetical protein